jgi:ribulose-phosphate 3-epimerase
MSVNPGFGGQTFMEEVIEKIEFVHHARQKRKLSFDIEVDGGINEATARLAVKAGANVLVAGSFLYGSSDMTAAIARLRACT